MTSATHPDGSGFDARLIAPLVLGALLNPVNSSMLAVALVPIGVAFGAPPSQTVWLVTGLYLATAVGQPIVGRLVDRYGARPLFLLGSGLVGAAGLLGAGAPNLGVLVLARVLIGVGTCAGYPAAMYLIRRESERTGLASPSGILTALTVSSQLTAVVGPTVGGLLVGVGGWRAIFLVNVPLAAVSLALGRWRLPRERVRAGSGAALDVPGIFLFTVLLTLLVLLLDDPHAWAWSLLAPAAVSGWWLVRRELRVADPFLDVRVLGTSVPLISTYVRQLLAMTVAYAVLYGYTQWLEAARGLSPVGVGLVLLPLSAAAVVSAALTGRQPRVRSKLVVGSILVVVAGVMVLLTTEDSAIWQVLAVAVVFGAPQGLLSLANQNALYHQADPARIGPSAGLLRTFGYVGALVAAAATAAFLGRGADTEGVHQLGGFVVACGLLLVAITLADRSLGSVGVKGPPVSR